MKNIFFPLLDRIQNKIRKGKKKERLERGQVLVIVALSVIALTAIVGLAIDTGLLYLNHGKLRRAVDAAALAATAQFREGYDTEDLQKAAVEFLVLNGINDPTARVETCKTNPGDPVLCTSPARKLVRVHATSVVKLSFLSVIGIRETIVQAEAVSEAASMDVVLTIDASESMTYDADPGDPMRDPAQCNPAQDCHPFEEVKAAAKAFVEELYFPYDRVAIVTFDNGARADLSFSDNQADILAAIDALEVVQPSVCPGESETVDTGPCRDYERYLDGDPVYGNNNTLRDEPIIDEDGNGIGDIYLGFDCPVYRKTGNPDTCPTTAIGHGLKFAGNEFGNKETFRQEALWVVILLTDGAANAPQMACPNNTWTAPFCRDLSPTSRHCLQEDATSCLTGAQFDPGGEFDPAGTYWPERYDADDYARDMADFVAEDQEALIFTIGLGDLVLTSVPRANKSDLSLKCSEVPYDPVENCYGAGELLMRYAAMVGKGKYYFAPTGDQLEQIFLDIAQYLATRLTR